MTNRIEDSFERLLKKFPEEYGDLPELLKDNMKNQLEEIRIRAGDNIVFIGGFGEIDSGISVKKGDMERIIEKLLDYSVYAHMGDLCKGFVTAEGGHRVGICGKAVMEDGKIKTIKDISSVNIRRSREVRGCGNEILKYLVDENDFFLNTLIISPPKCGKTTLMRDIIRSLSNRKFRISLVDERSEIAAMYRGVPQHDVGKRTDILDGGKKSEGIIMMIRSMSPEIVCTDEIGSKEDAIAVGEAVMAGIGVLTTVHGNNIEELKLSKIGELITEKSFERYIFLGGKPVVGTVTKILDREGKEIGY